MLVEFPKQKAPVVTPKWYEKKGWLAIGGVVLLFFALLTARSGVHERKQMGAFFKLSSIAAKLKKGEAVDRQELAKLLKEHPEIKPLITPLLMQSLQIAGEAQEAVRLGEENLKRLSYLDPLYLQYSKASLLIEKGDLKGALELSLDLKTKSEALPVLHKLNLKRIEFLSKV